MSDKVKPLITIAQMTAHFNDIRSTPKLTVVQYFDTDL